MTCEQYIPQFCRKKHCLSTTQQQFPSTTKHCSDNIHKEFGNDKCAKILLKKGKLVLSHNLILDIYTEIQQLEEEEQTDRQTGT
jgi:hypothetical protein